MDKIITQKMAQEIVANIKELSGFDANFIDTEGIIIASTNNKKINSFQELGKKAIKTGKMVENPVINQYAGLIPGISIPIEYHSEYIAALGIMGRIEEVKKYISISCKIVQIALKEQELKQMLGNRRSDTNYIVSHLIQNEPINSMFLKNFLYFHGLDITEEYRTIAAIIKTGLDPSEFEYERNSVESLLKSIHKGLFCFINPEYVTIIPASITGTITKTLTDFSKKHLDNVKIGIGMKQSLLKQEKSYKTAQVVIYNINQNIHQMQLLFDDLALEILLGSLPEESKSVYIQKTLSNLSKGEWYTLKAYYKNDMSLKATCSQLNMHLNTLQYKLNKIYEKCGYNPRSFQDGVILYMAIRLIDE